MSRSALEVVESVNCVATHVDAEEDGRHQPPCGHLLCAATAETELNRAVLYVARNEQTNHFGSSRLRGRTDPPQLMTITHIDRLYPHLKVDFFGRRGTFWSQAHRSFRSVSICPELHVHRHAQRAFPHRIDDLAGFARSSGLAGNRNRNQAPFAGGQSHQPAEEDPVRRAAVPCRPASHLVGAPTRR